MSTAHIICMGKRLKIFSLSLGQGNVLTFANSIQQSTRSHRQSNLSRKRNKRNQNWKWRSNIFSMPLLHHLIYRKL